MRLWQNPGAAMEPVAYLYRSVRSRILDAQRAARRRVKREIDAAAAEPFLDPACGTLETREAVEAALAILPREQAEIVLMKVWGRLTFPQIAQALDINLNTAASRYRYGLEALRKQLTCEVAS